MALRPRDAVKPVAIEASNLLTPPSSTNHTNGAAVLDRRADVEVGGVGIAGREPNAPHGREPEARAEPLPRKQDGGEHDTTQEGRFAAASAHNLPSSSSHSANWEENEVSMRRTESPTAENGRRSAASPRAGVSRKTQFRGFKRSPDACMALIREVLLRKPFSYGHVGPGWAAVADSLNSTFSDMFPPASDGSLPCTADNCRSAFDRIMDSWLKKGRVEDGMNGMDYDYSEWNRKLSQIHEAKHVRKAVREAKSGRSQPGGSGAHAGATAVKRQRTQESAVVGGIVGTSTVPEHPVVSETRVEAVMVDLRSDTVTRPTAEMRQAMMDAEVGDDVYGDDPTVAELEALTARMFKKQSGLLVPSGTMGNLIAVMSHCDRRGSEMIVGVNNHLVVNEQGGLSTVAGVHPRQIRTQTETGGVTPVGGMALAEIEESVRRDDVHLPTTRLVCLENSHSMCGGTALPADYVDAVGELCRRRGLKLHVDGARIFNAAAALNTTVSRLCRGADSVSCCLSKGLAAPVGSVLVGSEDFIKRARRHRKVLGGGMRQAGVIAACGLVSLNTMSKRLRDDHANARRLAEGLSRLPGVDVDLNTVHTNLVYFRLQSGGAHKLVAMLRGRGILMAAKDEWTVRAVLHYMVQPEACERAVAAVCELVPELLHS